jgi:hypothetical protein
MPSNSWFGAVVAPEAVWHHLASSTQVQKRNLTKYIPSSFQFSRCSSLLLQTPISHDLNLLILDWRNLETHNPLFSNSSAETTVDARAKKFCLFFRKAFSLGDWMWHC